MVDIFDERAYIKNILKEGFSLRWQRDASILARYYKSEGMNKKEIKEHIVEKCEMYVPDFSMFVYYKTVNKIVETAWKTKGEMRVIQQLEVSLPILEWFLSREDLSAREQRALFTIYGWSLIQAQYINSPYWHNLNQYSTLFKESAGIPLGTSLNNIKLKLCQLGYLRSSSEGRKNHGIIKCILYAQFIEQIPLLTNPIEEKDKIIILYDDMYRLGDFLERYRKKGKKAIIVDKEGKKVSSKEKLNKKNELKILKCEKCGEEFVPYTQRQTKLCKKCYEEQRNDQKKEIMQKSREKEIPEVKCKQCGKMFTPSPKTQRDICDDCYKEYRRKEKTENMRKSRKENKKNIN